MAYPINGLLPRIELGKVGEANATTIEFDVSEWLQTYPDSAIGITYQRPGSTQVYPASGVTLKDGILKWLVGAHALQLPGDGTLVARCIKDDTEMHSVMFGTRVESSHMPMGAVPEPMEDYVAEVLEAGQRAKQDADRAEQSADYVDGVIIEILTEEAQRQTAETGRDNAENTRAQFYDNFSFKLNQIEDYMATGTDDYGYINQAPTSTADWGTLE